MIYLCTYMYLFPAAPVTTDIWALCIMTDDTGCILMVENQYVKIDVSCKFLSSPVRYDVSDDISLMMACPMVPRLEVGLSWRARAVRDSPEFRQIFFLFSFFFISV